MWQSLASLPVAGSQGRPPVVAPERHALAVQPRVGIGGRGVRVIGALLAVEVALGIASATCAGRRLAASLGLGLEALHAGKRFDQGAIDREMLVREQRPNLGLAEHRLEELRRDLALQEPVAVLGEHRHVPDRRVHRQADEPAEQQVVVQLLHELALRAHRIESLQQQRPQQLLGRDRRPADVRIEPVEGRRQHGQRLVDDGPDRPQRVILRHPGLATQVAEQALRPNIAAPHRHIPHLVARCADPTRSTPSRHLFPQPARLIAEACTEEAAGPCASSIG